MATKPELEAEIETLKKELSDLKTADPAQLATQLDQLKADLTQLTVDLDTAKTELEKQKKLHDEALGDAKAWKQKHAEALVEADARTKQVADLEDAATAAASEPAVPAEDCVILGGNVHKIVRINSVKELSTDMLKRNVSEELTAVVIDRVH